MMDDKALQSRLSRISTIWTMVDDARQSVDDGAFDARSALIGRYQGAAYRYLLGALGEPDSADELFQEFAVSVLQGAFRHADPGRGRFRDYLKSALVHLVTGYRKRQRRQPLLLNLSVEAAEAAAQEDALASDERFLQSWRDEILARAWARLEQSEVQGGRPSYSILRFRAENPEASSSEMAAGVSERLCLDPPFTETAVRKALQRARVRFADAVVDEVAHSLGSPTHAQLEQELIDLNLLSYCRSALRRRA